MSDRSRLIAAALRLTEHAAAAGWRGSDPYDGLWYDWPAVAVGGRRRRVLITQLHVRAPVDIRRVYRRSDPLLAKGAALFASSALRVNALTGDPRAAELAGSALDVIDSDRRAGPDVWGYPFDAQHRWSFYPACQPSIVPTAFVAHALLDGERVAGRRELGDRARAAARWVHEELWVPDGHFAYHPHSRANIHNASLLGASLVWAALGEEGADRARQAVQTALAAQRADGSWPYGTDGNLGWADSFHTGYVLLCLDRLRSLDDGVAPAVARGADFYARFFGPRGESRLWPDRSHPEDGHSAGTALSALAALHRRGHIERERLELIAERLLTRGIRGGHVVFRRYRGGLRSFVHYPRWCDGHVALGLADAAAALSGSSALATASPAEA